MDVYVVIYNGNIFKNQLDAFVLNDSHTRTHTRNKKEVAY